MKLTKMMLILVAVFGVFLFASGQGYSSPKTYTGIDLAPLPSSPRPNSDAAAANFDAAAALLGPVNIITFEGLAVPSSSSFTAAPGVNVTYSGDYWDSVPTGTGTYYSGVNNVMVNNVWGFNTTAGGSQYLGLAPLPATTSSTDIIASITFSFAPPINAFGGYFSGLEMLPDTVTLNYATVNGTYSLVVQNATIDDPAVRLFGITDTDPIFQITLRALVPAGTKNYDWWGLDDVRYVSGSAAFKFPDTGQTLCYDSSGNVINCTGTGQDGAYNISPMSFTDNGNGTVTDKNTGLMWQKDDNGNRYTWYQASARCGSLTLGGHSDWRLPNKRELMSIADYSVPPPGPMIMTTYFPNSWGAWYWSSTTYAPDSDLAWYVDFYNGDVGVYGKDYPDHVRCVRGGQPLSPVFTDNGNGTVTDNRTAFMWQQGETGTMTWSSALSYCEGLSLGGNSDWRLPNIKELESITDDTRYSPAIDTTFFPDAKSDYWSSSTDAGGPNLAWHVPFSVGSVYNDSKASSFYVRCVRGRPETNPPTGSITIEEGAEHTNSTAVTLTLAATDESPGAIQMCISNTETCTAWTAFAETKNWTLATGDGTKTVNVWFQDFWGNENATPYSDTIILDTIAPTNGTVTATPGDSQVTLDWTGFTDTGSGIESYKVVYATGSAPTSCSAGTAIYTGADTACPHPGLTNGTTYYYRVCAIDKAENMSTGATAKAKPIPETNPPTGSITINGGVEATKSTAVTLTLAATDESPGAIQMCISNTETCTAWTAFAETKSWTLTTGNGTKTVNVWFQDFWGNENATPYSDTIILDTIAPTNGTVTAMPGNEQVTLDWTGFTDTGSGIESYKVVYATGGAPTSCSAGTAIYSGPNTTCPHTGLTNGTTYYYRVCAIDKAENMSAGATAKAKPIPETNPPAGSITIKGGNEATKSTAVTLTLAATDESPGAIQMCISNTATCTTWTAFASTKNWTLTTGDGTKTVNVWFQDVWGNENATPYSDTILLDTTAPTNGTVTATPGDYQVTLTWTGFTDTGSGIESYKVVYTTGSAPASCSSGTLIYSGKNTTYPHTGLTNTTYYYRVCTIDKAENMSTGATASAKPIPETNPPTGSITINGGDEATKSAAVTLTLTATDDSPGAIRMCISNTATCTAWTAFASTKSWTLATGNGTKTVNVWFKDVWDNVTATPYSDTILLDTIAPTNGTLTATPGNTEVTLDWNGFTDTGSGIESYKVVYAKGSAPASCSSGTAIYSGPNTTCPHAGLTNGTTYYYRVCAIDKAENMSTGVTAKAKPIPETNPPAGSITIKGGNEATKSTAVTLTLAATDESPGTIRMCISNTATCTTWTAFASTKSWTLATGDGIKTVNVWFKDVWDNVTATPNSDTILLDTAAPTNGTATATPGDAQVTLDWTGFTDTGSGVESYKVVFAKGAAPLSCSAGTVIYSGADTSYIHKGLTNGTKHGYRVCAIDKAGKISTGATASAKPIPETNPPTGSITINGGAEATKRRVVSLTLAATDDSPGAIRMCISNTETCTKWSAFTEKKNWRLTTGDGTKTVNVWFQDMWGNENVTPYSDTILLDTTAPTNGTLTATPGDTQVTLEWTEFTDTGSGIEGYKVIYARGSAPTSCSGGTMIYSGTDLSYTHTGLLNGKKYGYRVCAIDNVGNISTGATASTKPRPEFKPPTGSITIKGGAEATKTRAVSLTLAAIDDTPGAIRMCISNTATSCTTWTAFTENKSWMLTTGNETKTVYVWFQDVWDNVNPAPYSDTIILDTVAPTNGTVTPTPGPAQVTLDWTGFTDAGSGIESYMVVYARGSAPTSCSGRTPIYTGADTTYTHTKLTSGATYYYRVCARDVAGNMSTGATAKAKPQP